MILVVSEKPSVAQQIAKVLGANERKDGYMEGGDYIVSWCLGHLAEYVPPEHYDPKYKNWNFDDLPIIPEHWELSVASDKRDQFNELKSLFNRSDVTFAVNACDAGREGELIFKRVYDLSESRLPVKRLWISSMEDRAIADGFAHLKDASEYAGLSDAAVCRAKADWLVGMNATRAYTSVYSRTLRVGRVQTPTLAMLVERDRQIRDFIKEKYYLVHVKAEGLDLVSPKLTDVSMARDMLSMVDGADAHISLVDTQTKRINPPKLYDLTTLQRVANRYYGYTAKETLDAAQALYEAKLITYPRTDSQFITEDMRGSFADLIKRIQEFSLLKELGVFEVSDDGVNQVINNAKVSDHHAIIITNDFFDCDENDLSEKQLNILHLIWTRMVMAVAAPYIYNETAVHAECAGNAFSQKLKCVVDMGWKNLEGLDHEVKKQSEEDDVKDAPVSVHEGDHFHSVAGSLSEHFTTAPKAFTEDTLLQAMERAGNKEFDSETEKKGLGTPATRASIIEKLVHSGYARRKGKQIVSTEEGEEMIEVLPDMLKSASLTANWENQLLDMEHGSMDPDQFMRGIRGLIGSVLNGCELIAEDERQRFRILDSIGTCPKCGSLVFEGRRNFYCVNKECSFTLWKDNYYLTNMNKRVDARMAAEMLKSGRTHCKDLCSSKTGNLFAADIVMDASGEKVQFNLEFPKKYDKSQRKGKRK